MTRQAAESSRDGVLHGGAVPPYAEPLIVRPADRWQDELRECILPGCDKRFNPGQPKQAYCRDRHRWLGANTRKDAELELARGELGRAAVVRWLASADPETLRGVVREVRFEHRRKGLMPMPGEDRPGWRNERRDVYIPLPDWLRVCEEAEADDVPRSEVIRRAVRHWFKCSVGGLR